MSVTFSCTFFITLLSLTVAHEGSFELERALAAATGISIPEIRVLDSAGECVSLRTAIKKNGRIRHAKDEAGFKRLLQALSQQVSLCREKQTSPLALFSESHAAEVDHLESNITNSRSIYDIEPKVWVASIVAIIIISLVGLLGVAVVPLVQKVFYNHVLQFLVALAVGTLTGDAMLHLLPHAISGSKHHHDEDELSAILKGLAALGGIYFFFLAEKLVALASEMRAERKAEAEERLKAQQRQRKPSTINDWRQEQLRRRRSRCEGPSGHPLSSSFEDIVTVGLSSHAMKSIGTLQRYRDSEIDPRDMEDESGDEACERTKLTKHRLSVPARVEFQSEVGNDRSHEVKIVLPPDTQKEEEEEEVQIRHPKNNAVLMGANSEEKHEQNHGHGHGHGHSHEVPDSIASVAMMVILGDGLHNFTDGLAIGAAFAKGITGGLSTSIAVFCHELPHELGDFAVLLKTGMSVRQAIFYNMLSSVLCFIGMLIGISLGNVGNASFWIFAVTGGIFIYISLVDMLPELSAVDRTPGESRLIHFLLQNLGILTGISIMLLIALFEGKIKSAFG